MIKNTSKCSEFFVILVCFVDFIVLLEAFPGKTDITPVQIIKFMRRFGYLDSAASNSESLYHEFAIIEAVRNIQRFGALNETGLLDNETLRLMASPRCGVPDIEKSSAKRWQKRNINYFIANWSPKIGEEKVAKSMEAAFRVWSSYSKLNFKRVYNTSADIIVAFGTQYHGDSYPFDGPGNILAHAFYPYEMQSYGGDIHFDDDENWKENPTSLVDGVDFYSVAVHELGHSLGLGHSPIYSSIMFPYYKGAGSNNLDFDDIYSMYEMYIKGTFEDDNSSNSENSDEYEQGSVTNSAEVEVGPRGDFGSVDDDDCEEDTTTSYCYVNICAGFFDAVTSFRGEIFIFKKDLIWRLTEERQLMEGNPMKLREMFPFLPSNVQSIDAAYERSTDQSIVLFVGQQFWVYDGKRVIDGSPKSLTFYGIDPYIPKINAAMYWPKNQRTYLFADYEFWRYDDKTNKLDAGYPKSMARWRGIPTGIDAAATMQNGETYFFKHNKYWLYDNTWIRPKEGYPGKTSKAWLGCSSGKIFQLRKGHSVGSVEINIQQGITTPKSTTPTKIDDDLKICDGFFDAVTEFRGEVLIFKKGYVWRLTQRYRIMDGSPIKLREMFPFLPENVKTIDAAYERSTDKSIILFVGKQFWVYDSNHVIDGTPKSIAHYGIGPNVQKINAAMFWTRGRTYLFGHDEFWRFDDETQTLSLHADRMAAQWTSIPPGIDAAVTTHNGETYFFKDNHYWLYNNDWIIADIGYPRETNEFLGCCSEQKLQQEYRPTFTTNQINICAGFLDAVTTFRKEILVFKKDHVWKLTEELRLKEGSPIKLREMFPFLPEHVQSIDAAYERNTDHSLVLFVGQQFWVYDGNKVIDESPKPLTHYGIPPHISKLNAAMYWPITDRTYLFVDNEYWKYDHRTHLLDSPQSMEQWKDMPSGVDAVTTLQDGETYFFKQHQYWRFDNERFHSLPGYPRHPNQWLRCPL